ncbi:MAG TPA: hypothetical protein DCP02_06020 [Actinobacteria bacterium]|nr:hypothetical protein [Actinomycetota bacterium]
MNNRPAVIDHNSDGRLEIFVIYGSLWHIHQSKPSKGLWIGWRRLGNPKKITLNLIPVAVGQNSDGRLEVFAVDYWNGVDYSKGSLWHRYQPKPGKGHGTNWGSLGRPGNVPLISQSIVECDSDGCLVVFVANLEGSSWYRYQTESKKGPWSKWYSLGKSPASINTVAKNSDGRLEVFVRGAASGKSNVIWHNHQT